MPTENWTQPICSICWGKRKPGREPTRVNKDRLAEKCCDCGAGTQEGIYLRVDPKTVNFPKDEPTGPRYQDNVIPIPDHLRPVLDAANREMQNGAQIYFKWTCLHCGNRQTFEEEGKFFLEGQCEECEHISDLTDPKADVNFQLLKAFPTAEDLERLLKGGKPS